MVRIHQGASSYTKGSQGFLGAFFVIWILSVRIIVRKFDLKALADSASYTAPGFLVTFQEKLAHSDYRSLRREHPSKKQIVAEYLASAHHAPSAANARRRPA